MADSADKRPAAIETTAKQAGCWIWICLVAAAEWGRGWSGVARELRVDAFRCCCATAAAVVGM